MKAMGFAKLSARPRHYAQNELAVEDFKKRMARPSARRFYGVLISLRQRIRSHGSPPWPRWTSARLEPHKFLGIMCHFLNRAFQTPIDCQAIFTILPANLIGLRAIACSDPIMPSLPGNRVRSVSLCVKRPKRYAPACWPTPPPLRSDARLSRSLLSAIAPKECRFLKAMAMPHARHG
ncbi:winged helix-turn-helix domain-containing protein (plasmid) [Rhizobium tropici]|uniref:Winged helix-turn-helix domain-containing protein n=1 Tax=Rhizobium tropici TaxID=398 RepID=A0A6P1CJJ0_RHITR|nr:winged helix-turn-helix domain-containing protein [Rhizobium tropici]